MDWNNDGKHDYQDHAFYNNVVSPSENDKSQGGSSGKGSNYNSDIQQSTSMRLVWAAIICLVYLFLKLIGD